MARGWAGLIHVSGYLKGAWPKGGLGGVSDSWRGRGYGVGGAKEREKQLAVGGGAEGGGAWEVVLGGGGAKEPRVAGRGGAGLMIDRCVAWSVSGRG